MADIERYSFEDADGGEDGFTTFDVEEAKQYARKYKLKLIANIYEWTDSEMVEDNTEHDPHCSCNDCLADFVERVLDDTW